MIKEAIVKIVNKEDLSYEEAYTVMNEIMSGETTPTQNAAFLAALSTKSARAETTDEIAGCAAAMRDHATKVETDMDLFEIVGTGGDNAGRTDMWCSVEKSISRSMSGRTSLRRPWPGTLQGMRDQRMLHWIRTSSLTFPKMEG